MTQESKPPATTEQLSERRIAELMQHAGPRPTAADYGLQGFKPEAEARWQALLARRQQKKRQRLAAAVVALAATVALALVGLRLLTPSPPVVLGIVALTSGSMELATAEQTLRLAAGDTIPAGATVRLGAASGGALRLTSGVEIRLDEQSELHFAAADRLRLARGGVFIDTAGASSGGQLVIDTRLGSIRDIGTAFQVVHRGAEIDVLVRAGQVDVSRDGSRHVVDTEMQATLTAGAEPRLTTAAPFGPAWDWVLAAAPPFELEGAQLGAYLDWLQHETGWQPQFENLDSVASRALTLHGSLSGLRPEQSLDLVLPSCGLAYRLDGDRLVLFEQPTG